MPQIEHSLLPSGFADQLPPDARRQRQMLNSLLDGFAANGYDEVQPPLIEFEASLLAGSSPFLDTQTFRLLDPGSHQMMGLRADMTLQVARIARSRLADYALPLRLSYGGPCCRVTGQGLRKERQSLQVGLELIGLDNQAADHEVLRVMLAALETLGIGELSVDFSLPELPASLLESVEEDQREACRLALRQKDRTALASLAPALQGLLKLCGTAFQPVAWNQAAASLPDAPRQLLTSWLERLSRLQANLPALRMTLDPLEEDDSAYHHGMAFSLFSLALQEEIGRGGRYQLQYAEGEATPAIGATLYLNVIQRGLHFDAEAKRCFIPLQESASVISSLQQAGWQCVRALSEQDQPAALRCDYILQNGTPVPLTIGEEK